MNNYCNKFLAELKELKAGQTDLAKYASDPENLSPTTLDRYDEIIEARLKPEFGHKRIDQITTMQIVTFLKKLKSPEARLDGRPGPLDQGIIDYISRVLKNIFTRAVEWKLIGENPMEGISKPKNKDAKRKLIEQRKNPQYFGRQMARWRSTIRIS